MYDVWSGTPPQLLFWVQLLWVETAAQPRLPVPPRWIWTGLRAGSPRRLPWRTGGRPSFTHRQLHSHTKWASVMQVTLILCTLFVCYVLCSCMSCMLYSKWLEKISPTCMPLLRLAFLPFCSCQMSEIIYLFPVSWTRTLIFERRGFMQHKHYQSLGDCFHF